MSEFGQDIIVVGHICVFTVTASFYIAFEQDASFGSGCGGRWKKFAQNS